MKSPIAYIPIDRRQAIHHGEALPRHAQGAVLFADISGFTALTEALAKNLGASRGVDELIRQLNQLYDALIAEVHRFGGSVIGFSGDAITCWFDHSADSKAVARSAATAFAIQKAMEPFSAIELPTGEIISLTIKTAVAAGDVQRFIVGDPDTQLIDVIAGSPLDRMAEAEQLAGQGEALFDEESVAQLELTTDREGIDVAEWRINPQTGHHFAVVSNYQAKVAPSSPAPDINLTEEQLQPWLLPAIYKRIQMGQERFLAELRPAVALFLSFGGLDYHNLDHHNLDHHNDAQVSDRLDRYIRWVQKLLNRYEGSLIQLTTGDKGTYLYAAFGAPVAHDNDSQRAAAVALELCTLPPHLDFIIDVRIGIAQGRARVGAYGSQTRRTYGVQGDAINLSARLMSKAGVGQILVNQQIADAIESSHIVASVGMMVLKGKQTPTPVYTLQGERVNVISHTTTLHTNPIVGREHELAQMHSCLEVAQTAQGQVLLVEGSAGIGKSHLSTHFVEQSAACGWQVMSSFCQSTHQNSAYYACRFILQQLLSLPLVSSISTKLLKSSLEAINPNWVLRLPLLGDLLGIPIPDNATTQAFTPQLRQEALIALMVEMVQTKAATQPLILLFEDVHWIDESSQRIVLSLARQVEESPILLLLVQRPPLQDQQQFVLAVESLSYQSYLKLDELSAQGSEALATQRLNAPLSPLALSLVQRQAQGNPFFTEELLDAMCEAGQLLYQKDMQSYALSQPMVEQLQRHDCLVWADDQWTLASDAPLSAIALGIPDSIHGIVLSRLDRLPELVKLTLKTASVIGRIFEFDLLVQSHPAQPDKAALLEQLDVSEKRDFARLETPLPQLTYIFKHNITQEVVYHTLLEEQRQALHRTIGERLEEIQPNGVERLAFHFYNSDLEAEAIRVKALDYLDKAGHKAQHEYANETALNYFERGLALESRWQWVKAKIEILHILGRRDDEKGVLQNLATIPDMPEAEVAYLWGAYYESISDYEAAEQAFGDIQRGAKRDSDIIQEIGSTIKLAYLYLRMGRYHKAKEAYLSSLTLIQEEACNSPEKSTVCYGLGIVHQQEGDYPQAEKYLLQGLALNRTLEDRAEEARTLTALGNVAHLQSNFTEAIDYNQQALQIRRMIGDRAGEGASLVSLAQAMRETGDYSQEIEKLLYEALHIQQTINNRWSQALIWNALGILQLLIGNFSIAQQQLQQGLDIVLEIGIDVGQTYILCNLGQVLREQGKLVEAEEALSTGIAIARTQNIRHLEAIYLSELALVQLKKGQFVRAIEEAESALALRHTLGLEASTSLDLMTLAIAYAKQDESEKALAHVAQALALLASGQPGGSDFPERDYFSCYRLLSAVGQPEAALNALSAAYQSLNQRAGQISDQEMRRSYLENIPVNREIVQKATSLGL